MPQFILTINLGNEGMCSELHITQALKKVGAEIDSVGMLYHETYPISDINGNVVGHYEVV